MQPKELHKIWFRPSVPSESNILHLGRLRLRRGIKVLGVALSSRDSSVGLVTRLQAEGLGIRIPPRVRNCPLPQNAQTGPEAHPASIRWKPGFFRGGKSAGA